MKNYEAIVIFYPDVEEEVRQATIDRLTNIIETNGKVEEVEHWGDKKFAYPIQYHNHGYYTLFKFQAEPETEKEFNRIARISESIIRQMTINLDK